jgi:hypothetical protein
MSRRGKIARLPRGIREQLNRRLEDGEMGAEVLGWLNGLPECKKVCSDKFGGRPINEQNLSEWKQGGYEEWVRYEAARERVQSLMERGEGLDQTTGVMDLADRLASVVAAELAEAVEELGRIADGRERWQRLQEISQELARLRRGDYHGKRFLWEKECRECELEEERAEWARKRAASTNFEDFKAFLLAMKSLENGGGGGRGAEKAGANQG